MDSMQTAVVVALAVVALVAYRQMMTRPTARRGILYFSVIMIVIGFAGGGVLDSRHLAISAGLVAVELAGAVLFGAVRASTVRVWRDEAGIAWSRGTGWMVLAWLASIASRVALYTVGHALGLATAPLSIFVFVGVTIGVQSALVARRGAAVPGRSPSRITS